MPFGKDGVVIARGAMTVMVMDWVAVAPSASFTWTTKVNEPTEVGVPLTTPELEIPSPGGGKPEEGDQVYGGVPPMAENVWK